MTLSVGTKVVYPNQGPCLIGAVVEKVIGGMPKNFYRLAVLDDGGENWKQRVIDNTKLLASGSAFDLANIVESLTQLGAAKPLSLRDRQMLERARKILVCEISEVTGKTKSAVAEQIDHALQRREGA